MHIVVDEYTQHVEPGSSLSLKATLCAAGFSAPACRPPRIECNPFDNLTKTTSHLLTVFLWWELPAGSWVTRRQTLQVQWLPHFVHSSNLIISMCGAGPPTLSLHQLLQAPYLFFLTSLLSSLYHLATSY